MSTTSIPVQILSRPLLSPEEVLAKCAYFMRTQLWPRETAIDPQGWLSNFHVSELSHAAHLLNAFMYFASPLVKEMFASSFQSLSRSIAGSGDSLVTLQGSWRTLIARSLITYVTGEVESPTDSGHIFARLVRDYLGIPETQIRAPKEVLQSLLDNGPRPVIFVDDFVGSGLQFATTWNRQYSLNCGIMQSFKNLAAIQTAQFFYASVMATNDGFSLIRKACPEVVLSTAHELHPRYSLLHPECFLWPDSLRPTAVDFLRTASLRAGIPDSDGNHVDDWQGFHKLGLAIAFEHGTPDATVAILRWKSNGWHPLIVGQ